MGDDWDDSLQSKEQLEANLLSKHEAAIRRERALAYAFSHQVTLSTFHNTLRESERFNVKLSISNTKICSYGHTCTVALATYIKL